MMIRRLRLINKHSQFYDLTKCLFEKLTMQTTYIDYINNIKMANFDIIFEANSIAQIDIEHNLQYYVQQTINKNKYDFCVYSNKINNKFAWIGSIAKYDGQIPYCVTIMCYNTTDIAPIYISKKLIYL
jgi:hypothetical protein